MAQLVAVLLSVLCGVRQDLSSFQMLLICLFTDTMPALALCMEKAERDLLLQAPRHLRDSVMNNI